MLKLVKKERGYDGQECYYFRIVEDGQEVGTASVSLWYKEEEEEDPWAQLMGSEEVEEEPELLFSFIDRIDVDEEKRGQGLGRRAIEDIGEMFSSPCYASPDNEDSARLFGRIGEDASWVPELAGMDYGFGVYRV